MSDSNQNESEVEFPVYMDYDVTRTPPQLEQDIADLMNGEKATMRDVMHGNADSSDVPDIEYIPSVIVQYGIDEEGDVVVSAVGVEEEDLVYKDYSM